MKNSSVVNIKSILGLLLITTSSVSFCQQAAIVKYLTELPKNLKLDNNRPQTYNVSIHWINRDLDGNLINNNIVKAKYARGFENGFVRWEDVRLTNIRDTAQYENQLTELNGLTYKIIGDNFTKKEFYDSFPKEGMDIDIIRWLVQDAVGIEVYGWMYFDSLKFNQVFYPNFFKNQRIKMENYVNFTSQGLSLCWTSISKMNNEMCAIIHYQSMHNPIDANTDVMKLHGRSTYWGDIWISLTNKHIEYATMNEDVIFKMILTANKYEQKLDLQREVVFEKTN
ncbi:MAG: hypothetical protein NTX44_15470 [Ignavibacteriales bacterium]|nr:hypothetical protein [Ignavibacteriales bacterium]